MTLGQKLVALRKAKKLTQKAVADELGVSSRAYFNWEKDESKPSKDTVKKLSDFYGEELSAYIDGKNAEEQASDNTTAPAKTVKTTKAKKVMPKESAPKKTAPKEVPTAPKKEKKAPAPKKEAEIQPKPKVINVELQYAGKAITYAEIIKKAAQAAGSGDAINIYIKPEENRAYYVSGGNVGSFEI